MMNTAVEQIEPVVAHAFAKAQPPAKFDLNRCSIVASNFQLDKAISLKDPPDAACIVTVPKGKEVQTTLSLKCPHRFGHLDLIITQPVSVIAKPCSAYLHYVEAKILSGTEEHTLRKFKGFTSRFTASVEVKAGVKGGIFGCEASLEVTTGFSYGEEITEEKEETWKTTVSPGKYVVYQTVVLNSPFTISYHDGLVDDVGYDTLIDHLMGPGFSKWEF
ncbi:hypothetical protein BG005_002536 [Podila minutissima]|nr:hypothetical protein BG005_002536 [Podila minutissima]